MTALKSKLNAIWSGLDEDLSRLEALMADMDQAIHQSSDDEWSLMDIAQHLYITEKVSLQYLQYKLAQSSSIQKPGRIQRLKLYLLLRFLKSKKKVKAPEIVDPRKWEENNKHKTSESMFNDFRKTRNELKAFLNDRDTDYLEAAIFKHPTIGRINALGMMKFFDEHFKRHLVQARDLSERLKASSVDQV